MYLLYIDDSGTANKKRDKLSGISGGNSRYFVLGAVLIKANELNKCQKEFDDFKQICFKNIFDEIKHSGSNKFLKCTENCNRKIDKNCYNKHINDIIAKLDCVIFSCSQDKYLTTTSQTIQSKLDIYLLSFQNLIHMVDNYMHIHKIQDSVIVFIDKKDCGDDTDKLIYNAYKKAISNPKLFKSFYNSIFAPSINVVYSQYTIGCQIADFISGSIWAALEDDNIKTKNEKKEKNSIIKSKTFSKDGIIENYGYKICTEFIQ